MSEWLKEIDRIREGKLPLTTGQALVEVDDIVSKLVKDLSDTMERTQISNRKRVADYVEIELERVGKNAKNFIFTHYRHREILKEQEDT